MDTWYIIFAYVIGLGIEFRKRTMEPKSDHRLIMYPFSFQDVIDVF